MLTVKHDLLSGVMLDGLSIHPSVHPDGRINILKKTWPLFRESCKIKCKSDADEP